MNLLTKIFLLIIFLFYAQYSLGQKNLLEGIISDQQSGKAIQGAVVFLNHNYFSYSNTEGIYQISNIPEGNYYLRISRIGYGSVSDSIKITKGLNKKDILLELTPIELDEVIVSTDRTGNYLRHSAYSELLIDNEEIEVRPYQTVPDVLKYEPGISLIRDGIWGTEVNIRGLSRENVVTLIDGSRIVTSTDISARLSMIDINDIDRIEVIKGASSSIYGSGATGGIVNVITRSPQFSSKYYLNGSITGGFNSVNNLNSTSGIFTMGESFWSSKIAGSYRNAGNVMTPAGELKNSQFEDYSLSAALNIKPFENQILKFNYQLFKAENVGIPGASIFPGNAVVRYPDEKRELISAQYEVFNISKLIYRLSAKYAYQFIDRNVENIPNTVQNMPGRRVSVLKITPGAEHRNNNIEILGNLLLSDNNNLIAGIDYWDRSYMGSREKFQKIEMLNPAGEVTSTINKIIGEKPLPDSRSNNIGIFIQDESELLSNKLSLSVGLRADKIFISGEETRNPVYEITNGIQNQALKDSVIWNRTRVSTSSYSSNMGLRYSLSENTDLTLSLGLSFRSPSLEERFQFIDQGNFIRLGNPELKSEIGKSADIGFRYYLSDLKILTSIFYNHFNDLVVEEPGFFDERPAFIKANIGKARLYGFDLSIEYSFFKDLIFYSINSIVKGDDIIIDKPLPGIPPFNSTTGVRLRLFNKVEGEISSDIFAAQTNPAAGELYTPGYALLNLSLNSMPINLSLISIQIYSGIENIFDKGYRNHLATTRGNLRLEPGRNFYIKLITRW